MPVGSVTEKLRRPTRGDAATAGGWLVVLMVVVVALAGIGDRPLTVVTYLLVWGASTTLPGVLVWRALSRPTSMVQELGFGSVLGIGLLILAWAPATLSGHPQLMWLWPIGAVAAFALVPRLRRHWRPRRLPEHRTPRRWHLAMMVVALLGFLRLWSTALRSATLPPRHSTIFQDVWYELELTQRLRYSVRIDDPAVAGVPLHYHWFSNAHAAATQVLSGAPTYEVVMRLWLVAMLFTLVFVVAAAAERLLEGAGPRGESVDSRRWWPGPLAALLLTAFPAGLNLGRPRVPKIDNVFVVSSISGILALCIVLALVGPTLDLLHGRKGRGAWVLLGLLLLLSTGSKPSILPVVACGSALTMAVQWLRTRRLPRVAAIMTAASVLLIPLAGLTVTGSTGGSRPQLLDILSLDDAMKRVSAEAVQLPGHGGWLTPDLVGGSGRAWAVAAGLLVVYTLTELPRLLGIFAVADRTLSRDPGIWWCAGVVASGYCGLWTLAHPAYSEHYFWRVVVGLGMVLTVTSAVRLLPPGHERGNFRPQLIVYGAAGLATGAALAVVRPRFAASMPGRLAPYGVALLVFVLLVVASRRRHARVRAGAGRLPVYVVATTFCVATALATVVGGFAGPVASAIVGGPVQPGPHQRTLSASEQEAALWVEAHSAPDDLLATNVFCAVPRYRVGCRHVSFWVSALTGRQMYIGAWSYTEKNLDQYSHADVDYKQTPSPWPGRVALSLAAVRSPTPRVIARLRHDGVRWIFADRRATRVSPRLDQYAHLRFANSDVRVYELT